MSKDLSLAQKVRSLKVASSFTVATEKERQQVCRVAKSLKDAGVIEFDVVTKRDGDIFKVAAI
jgi:hypothetical protein